MTRNLAVEYANAAYPFQHGRPAWWGYAAEQGTIARVSGDMGHWAPFQSQGHRDAIDLSDRSQNVTENRCTLMAERFGRCKSAAIAGIGYPTPQASRFGAYVEAVQTGETAHRCVSGIVTIDFTSTGCDGALCLRVEK